VLATPGTAIRHATRLASYGSNTTMAISAMSSKALAMASVIRLVAMVIARQPASAARISPYQAVD
jgi:hypothetical protein